jgi:hypothetical protein
VFLLSPTIAEESSKSNRENTIEDNARKNEQKESEKEENNLEK